MALPFLPSLQHLAAVRVALTVFHDDIIHFLEEVHMRENYNEHPLKFDNKEESWIRESQQKARNKLSKLVPKLFEDPVVLILQPIVIQIHYWIRDHFHVLKYISKRLYVNSLCWKLEGTIDRINTAKNFIRNGRIDKRNRFIMACIYFFENDVKHLFQSMAASQRRTIFYVDSNIAVHFWMKWLKKNNNSPWTECVPKYLTYNFLRGIKCNSRIRLLSFFTELSMRNKSIFLHFLYTTERAHFNDLHQCYNLLDETARGKIIQSHLRPVDVLCCYLNWPLQSLFLDAVNQMKRHLNVDFFDYCLHWILRGKLMRGMQDFDYLKLLKDLWNQIPDTYKEEIQKNYFFHLVHAALSCDEKTHPLAIQKLLKDAIQL